MQLLSKLRNALLSLQPIEFIMKPGLRVAEFWLFSLEHEISKIANFATWAFQERKAFYQKY